MTMTKADIVERIYEKVGFSKKEATEVVESIFELVKERLEQGEKVKISGFGNFVVNEKRPRKGRNPQTGEEIVISGRRVLTFKASQVLKKTMNGGGPPPAGARRAPEGAGGRRGTTCGPPPASGGGAVPGGPGGARPPRGPGFPPRAPPAARPRPPRPRAAPPPRGPRRARPPPPRHGH